MLYHFISQTVRPSLCRSILIDSVTDILFRGCLYNEVFDLSPRQLKAILRRDFAKYNIVLTKNFVSSVYDIWYECACKCTSLEMSDELYEEVKLCVSLAFVFS